MIKIIQYKVGISPKLLIQKIVDMMGIDNGQIIIKVQNKKFVQIYLQPSFKPDELDATEIKNNENKWKKTWQKCFYMIYYIVEFNYFNSGGEGRAMSI